MRYIVGNRGPLKVGDEMRQPGEPIPEAAEWAHLHTWVSGGYVIELPDGADAPQGTNGQAASAATLDVVLAFIASADATQLAAIEEAVNARVETLTQAVESSPADADSFDITAVNADQAKAWILETKDVAALEAQNEREVQNEKHPGGRVSVTRAIEARIDELQAAASGALSQAGKDDEK